MAHGVAALKEEGVLEKDIIAEYSLDCRYLGQSYFLNVKWKDLDNASASFQEIHEKRYGHKLDLDIEVVNLRLALKSNAEEIILPKIEKSKPLEKTVFVKLEGIEKEVPVIERDNLVCGEKIMGPALITETVSTTYLAPNWSCTVDESACLLLKKYK